MKSRKFISILWDFEADDSFPNTVNIGNLKIKKFTGKLRNQILNSAKSSVSKGDFRRFTEATHLIEYSYKSDDYSSSALSSTFADVQSLINVFRIMKPSNTVGFGVDLTHEKNKITRILFLEPDQKKMYSTSPIPDDYIFNKIDSRHIKKFYLDYETLAEHDGYNRRATSYYFYAGYFQTSPFNARLKVVALVSAIEALFNTGIGDASYKVSLRFATYISKTPSRRKNVYKDIKYLYSIRSKIVHGQSLGKAVYKKDSEISLVLYRVEQYLRIVFMTIVENKLQNIFALENKELDEKFDDFLLGVSRLTDIA